MVVVFKNNYKLIYFFFTSVQRLSSIYRNVEDYVRCETMGKKNKCS